MDSNYTTGHSTTFSSLVQKFFLIQMYRISPGSQITTNDS